MSIIAVALVLLLAAAFVEESLYRRTLEKIPLRILVNGTRGKTSVTRLLAAALNEAGISAYAKTTGSDARWLLPDGSEIAYRRRLLINIMEQLTFIRYAAKGEAKAVVVECMALRPENQWLMAMKLVCQHYTVITNAYVDHLEEIGETQEETVRTLSLSIAPESCVVSGDERFGGDHRIKPAADIDLEMIRAFPYPVFEDNLRLAFALTDAIGIPRSAAKRGMLKARPDIGMVGMFRVGDCWVQNAFSANDPDSFSDLVYECRKKGPYLLLFNHRADRPLRLRAFAYVLRGTKYPPDLIGVIGENKAWASRYLKRITSLRTCAVQDPDSWLRSSEAQSAGYVLCAGNIKGEGRKMLEHLLEEMATDV